MKAKQDIINKIEQLPNECHCCEGKDKREHGECGCSYSEKCLVDVNKVLKIIKK